MMMMCSWVLFIISVLSLIGNVGSEAPQLLTLSSGGMDYQIGDSSGLRAFSPFFYSLEICRNIKGNQELIIASLNSSELYFCVVEISSQVIAKVTPNDDVLVKKEIKFGNIKLSLGNKDATLSAIAVGLDLCLVAIDSSVNQFKGNLFACVTEVGMQIAYFRQRSNLQTRPIFYVTIYKSWYVGRDPVGDIPYSTDTYPIDWKAEYAPIIFDNKLYLVTDLQTNITKTSDSTCAWRHTNLRREHKAGIDPSTLRSTDERGRGAIVYLASARGGIEALADLQKSLDLLYANFNDRYHEDVWIFHEGDLTLRLQALIRKSRPEIRFFHLHGDNWATYPPFVVGRPSSEDFPHSIGYRKMIRFFSLRIWPVMASMGYTWVTRLDDDSFILSPIRYNVFDYMHKFGYQYAYRNIALESPGYLFWDFMQSYIENGNITDVGYLMDSCMDKSSPRNFTYPNCGLMPSYYTNFFVANVTRWLDADVQALLQAFDDTGMIFLERWGDLTIHTAVVKLLFPEAQVVRLAGFAYAHFSENRFGIVQSGAFDEDPRAVVDAFSVDGDPEYGWMYGALLTRTHAFCAGRVTEMYTCLC